MEIAKNGKIAKPTKEWLKKSPIDFIYVFATDDFISLVREYIGSTAANTIYEKKLRQNKFLANFYGGYKKINYDEVRSLIVDQYGKNPGTILSLLLQGETVAGKNWKEGVYGVGAIRQDGFDSSPELMVDTETGTISNKNGTTYQGVATYDKKGNITGYTYQIDGGSYTTQYDKSSGKYYANTYGTADNMYYANNTPYTPATASSVWENISTAMPLIENFLNWIASLASSLNLNFSGLTTAKTVPQQKELSTVAAAKSSEDSTLNTVLIAGAALVGGMLIFGDRHDRKRR